MLALLRHPNFAKLFAAQVVALAGTGLLTIALGLLAYDLAGGAAGAVLGTAYAIKMVAYVGLAPIMGALVSQLPRRAVLISADLVRIGVALCLPFVTTVGQIYGLIFLLQAASATFTPTFQAVIPDLLTDEQEYTQALSMSRLAYDMENLLSPALAGLLLLFVPFGGLFVGTAVGFALSTLFIFRTTIPRPDTVPPRPFLARVTRGSWIYLATPRLRGLLAFNLAAASATAYVLVNTVVLVSDTYGRAADGLAIAMAAFGAGSMLAALLLPRLLKHIADRAVVGSAAFAIAALTLAHAAVLQRVGPLPWPLLLGLWFLIGAVYSAVMTPSGRLLRRSANTADRPAVFTAHFALSHACWLIAYPLAGWSATWGSQGLSLTLMGTLALLGALVGRILWRPSPQTVPHDHPDLPDGHPHLLAHNGNRHHNHVFVIDDEHHVWPTTG